MTSLSHDETGGERRVKFAGYRPEPHSTKPWTKEREDQLRELWADPAEFSCAVIAQKMGGGLTKNAVLGKGHRLKLPPRRRVPPPRPRRALVRRMKIKETQTAMERRLANARMSPSKPLLAFLADPSPPPKSETWRALPGSSPISIEDHTDGCRWPIGDDRPYRYCNLPVESGSYCGVHARVSARRAYTISPHFTDPPLDDDNSLAAQAEPARTV